MRILLALALLLLAGCPAKETTKDQAAPPAKTTSPAMRALTTKLSRPYPLKQTKYDDFPPAAAAYLEASLNDLMSGGVYAPKEMTLSYMGMVPGCQIGRDAILKEVEISGEMLAPALIAAYIAADPEACLKYLQRQANAGNSNYIAAIGPDKEVGTWVLEHVHTPAGIEGTDAMLLNIIIGWDLDPTPFLPNLRALIGSGDPVNSVKAAGYLVSKDIATLEEKQFIADRLKAEDMMEFTGGIEALKLTGDPALADGLVSIVAEAEIGELDPEIEVDLKAAFTAYGLTSLGGEQAQKLRLRLLGSVSPVIRMEAALGELMHGDSSHWNKFVKSGKYPEGDIMAALKPVDAVHLDLLPFYLHLTKSETTHDRLVAVEHMSRYREYSSNADVAKVLENLFDDPEVVVRERTWILATLFADEVYLDKALAVLQNGDEHPKVRIAATMCAMQPALNRINRNK